MHLPRPTLVALLKDKDIEVNEFLFADTYRFPLQRYSRDASFNRHESI